VNTKLKNTKVMITVRYEVEYEGQMSEDDVDGDVINDVIRNQNSIKDIKVKTKVVKNFSWQDGRAVRTKVQNLHKEVKN
jgi:hypothetical protein